MKRAFTLLLALPILLMSTKCEDKDPVVACIFQNKSQDTLAVVVSTEYPDTLYPMKPAQHFRYIFPGRYEGIYVDYWDWNSKDFVLQIFVYDASIPQLGTNLRDKHVENAYYKLTKKDILDREGVVTYPPQPVEKE